MIRLLEYVGSPNCARVRFALEEAGLQFEAEHIKLETAEHRSTTFRALNPTEQVPVIVESRTTVFGSQAILLHLGDRHPESKLMPEGVAARAEALSWFFWVGRLNELTWVLFQELRDGGADALVKEYREDVAERLALLEKRLTEKRFICGRFSIVDISALPTSNFIPRCGFELEKYPQLLGWQQRMKSRPAWEKVMAAYRPKER